MTFSSHGCPAVKNPIGSGDSAPEECLHVLVKMPVDFSGRGYRQEAGLRQQPLAMAFGHRPLRPVDDRLPAGFSRTVMLEDHSDHHIMVRENIGRSSAALLDRLQYRAARAASLLRQFQNRPDLGADAESDCDRNEGLPHLPRNPEAFCQTTKEQKQGWKADQKIAEVNILPPRQPIAENGKDQ